MRPTALLPALGIAVLALAGCGTDSSSQPSPTTSTSNPSSTSSPSASKTATPTPTAIATPSGSPAPEAEISSTAPVAEPPAAPAPVQEAPAEANPADLTPGEWCERYEPISSGGIQTCHGIAQGYIDPVTGDYIGDQALPDDVSYGTDPGPGVWGGEDMGVPDSADPDDPSTWSGTDEEGGDWAVIGPPPEDN